MTSVKLVQRFYSTPIRIYNFSSKANKKYIKNLEKQYIQKRDNSYSNMYNALKKKILSENKNGK